MDQPIADRPPPPWMDVAFSQHGVREIPGPKANPQILAYHATTTLRATSDETPWCSAFVNWCFHRARLMGTDSARARSWLDWGVPLQRPVIGCVAVLQRPARGPDAGHVALWWSHRNPQECWLYGGNQDNTVGLKAYPRIDILGFRWPSDFPSP